MNKLISIIVVNYNGAELLEDCIEAINKQTYKNWELIIVDNNSTDNSIEIIKQYSYVKLIESKENLGFAKGNNVGINESLGEFIALINNDATAEVDWLEKLYNTLVDNSELGSCGCKIISYFDKSVMDSAGLVINSSGMSRGYGRLESVKLHAKSKDILIPSGCAVLYRKKALDEVGLFDEDFFCYCEDTDLGLRLQIAGWKCRYVSDAIVYHRYSVTAGKYSLFKTYLVERNHFWLVIKNYPLSKLLMNPVYTLAIYMYQVKDMYQNSGAASEIVSNYSKKQLIGTLLKAHWHVWISIFVMLKKRKDIYRLKKVSNKEMNNWFRDYGIGLDELFKQ